MSTGNIARDSLLMEELLDFVQEGLVIPIIGPDLLLVRDGEREILLRQLIAERLAGSLDVPHQELGGNFSIDDVVAAYLDRREPPERVYSRIQYVMKELNPSPPESLRKLASIKGFKLFVSTSFDNLLESALNEHDKGDVESLAYAGNEASDLPRPLGEMDRRVVYHLFGKVSSLRNAYAVTEEDTLEFMCALQSEGKRPKRLFDTLRDRHLLFIGCNFSDWLARFFIRTVRSERLSHYTGIEFVADPRMVSDPNLVLFLHRFRRSTELLAPEKPADFVDHLYRCWSERQASASARETSDEMGREAIFISYASEDREAALQIKTALERENIATWMDRKKLEGGDDYTQQIRRNIEQCTFFLPVISSNTQRRDNRFFRKEWRWAVDRAEGFDDSDPFILPVSIDGMTADAERLPEKFRRVQWFSIENGAPSEEFMQRIRSLCSQARKAKRDGGS